MVFSASSSSRSSHYRYNSLCRKYDWNDSPPACKVEKASMTIFAAILIPALIGLFVYFLKITMYDSIRDKILYDDGHWAPLVIMSLLTLLLIISLIGVAITSGSHPGYSIIHR